MGTAIVKGLIASGGLAADDIAVSSPRQVTLDRLSAACPGITASTDNRVVIKGADYIILAVKPWVLPTVIEEVASHVAFRQQTLVSLAAGVSIADISEMLRRYSSDRSILRVIPNTAMSVGASMTFICHDNVSDARLNDVVDLFNHLGTTAVIEERLIGAGTALCSCGIAYVMRYIRAATEGGVQLGFYPDKAKEYMLATMKGAIKLLESTGSNPESEIDKVTTPGGITIKGLNAMERAGFTAAVIDGLVASR